MSKRLNKLRKPGGYTAVCLKTKTGLFSLTCSCSSGSWKKHGNSRQTAAWHPDEHAAHPITTAGLSASIIFLQAFPRLCRSSGPSHDGLARARTWRSIVRRTPTNKKMPLVRCSRDRGRRHDPALKSYPFPRQMGYPNFYVLAKKTLLVGLTLRHRYPL